MIEQRIRESIAVKQELLNDRKMIETIDRAVNAVIACFSNGHRLWLCGNGGSAADAQHIAAELSGRFYLNRPPLPAEAFTVNTSYLTAVANDFSFNEIFSRLTQAHCRPGDILVGISTSGNSANVLRALTLARDSGITTIALTGNNGGEMKHIADYSIIVPSNDTPRIQETHILIGHIICELVESSLFRSLK
ncbi:MAG: D-sedoheptulose 7-phosphate isomerase [Bacteroidales bacterium]|jgi:D-sedoheptulose 7-phosphate isomerase|nr:D-sedoheptulose 7-phosphate isomerase [Bacteroidales bacterium]HPB01719.1 D-sedoheptulose 7-phosphate isomerase [Bacteroidales bacterium]HPF00046.1 D-sedoheptulose 7-phosphate isomerase [Bacteroidales bacterium]